jgi:hypothetical protein
VEGIHHRILLGGLHGVFTTGVYSGRTYKLELICVQKFFEELIWVISQMIIGVVPS